MKRSKHKKERKSNTVAGSLIRAEVVAIAVTLALIALTSLLLYQGILNIESLNIINTVLKVLGGLTAAIITSCLVKTNRLFMCILSGVVYIVLSYIILSLFSGRFEVNVGLWSDIAIGAGVGFLVAVITSGKGK